MKNLQSFIFLFLFSTIIAAQNYSYIDSITNIIKPLSTQEQIKYTLKIPHDKLIGDITKYEVLVNSSISKAIILNDTLTLANLYLQLAVVSAYKDKRKDKIAYSLQAISLFEKINSLNNAGIAYCQLGFQMKHENMLDALYYMRKGIKLSESTIETSSIKISNIDGSYDNYGILQGMLKQYDSAIYYHKRSLYLKKENNDSIGIPYSYVHIATVNLNLKKFDIAKKYIDSSLYIRNKRNDIYGITDSYAYYGDLYFAEEKYNLAIQNFKKGFDLSIKNNFQSLQKYCAQYLTKSFLLKNDYKNAYQFNTIYQSLKDSILNVQTNNKVAELQIEFETTKKEKEITHQKEELLQQELEIKTKNLFSIILGLGLLVLGLIAYFIYKKKQQLSKELKLKDALAIAQTQNKLQDQRLRISRDLHDNIGSQLTFIISSIDNLKFISKSVDEKFISKLSTINLFTANTISQLRDTIWAMNKQTISYEDFHGRVLTFIEKAKIVKENVKFNYMSHVNNSINFSSINGITLFRVIQESINNVLKHANATQIDIDINDDLNTINISIKDNGDGFDINTIEFGNGLNNMHKRIEEINGELEITSTMHKGTSILIRIDKNTANAV